MSRTLIPLLCLLPALALGQPTAPLTGRTQVVNDGPGDQTDPHVSGALVAYTHQSSLSSSEIRYHDLLTGEDRAIPTEGGYDALADISGNTIVFTRTTDAGRIFRFDVGADGGARELAPRSGAERRAATLGGRTVAWQELGYTAESLPPEIFAYRLDTLALTRLTEDTSMDRSPAVSADGRVVVWTRCATSVDGCDLWAAREVEGGYEVSQLTGPEGEESLPDTNGEVVAYVTRSLVEGVLESDIAWQPVGGGEVHRLALPGTDTNPNVSGPLIAFERRDASSATPNFDVVLYDLRTQTYYRLTETPESETLSDISMDAEGLVRVVWTVRQGGNLNVHSYVFRLPADCTRTPIKDTAAVCASPGTRSLLGSLVVSRSEGAPEVVSTEFESTGTGVLCVDNGFEASPASAGWVWLGVGLHVGPDEIREDVTSLARRVPLQGRLALSAQVAGSPGSAFRVRLYGEMTCDIGPREETSQEPEARYGQLVPAQVESRPEAVGFTRYFVPSGYEGKHIRGGDSETGGTPAAAPPEEVRVGCGAAGGPVVLLGVWMFASLLLRDRRGTRARSLVVSRR
ncbi:hypothetical protein BO221_28500 [Archangium sp. Cb G35]|uniref:TolB family protein n=1 Tax=Archangium sp. Cb G35 TaxID=1920190 RepID=UPI000965164D|nr:hypothetical protein [Archangium sp. Cb G35]OJT20848.1 hypothetical protein BO221_28500 [Archangium sp. Cb G35]